jgi:hypothetical protein
MLFQVLELVVTIAHIRNIFKMSKSGAERQRGRMPILVADAAAILWRKNLVASCAMHANVYQTAATPDGYERAIGSCSASVTGFVF